MTQYKAFKVADLFDHAELGDTNLKKTDLTKNGDLVITSGKTNCGILGRTTRPAKVFPGNTITVDMFGYVYYRDFPYKMVTHGRVMSLASNIIKDREVGLYLASSLSYLSNVFGYNNMATWKKLQGKELELPVTPAGDPDFEYMTMRIRELEADRIRELEAYLRVTGLGDTKLSASEAQALTQNVKWKKFKVGDVFDKKTVKGYPKKIEDLTSVSDGYHTFGQNIHYQHCQRIKMPDKYLFKVTRPILAYASSTGSVGMINESFYRSGDNGAFQALLPKFDDKQVTTMLFILVVMKRIFAQFNYNTNVRGILDMDILLPVTPDDQIDFDYMQNYIRATEKQTIKGVVEYKDRVIKETKKVVGE